MNTISKSLLALSLGSLCLSSSANALPRSSSQGVLCEGLSSYAITSDGRCINLSYVNGGRPQFLPGYEQKITEFEQALAQIGVPISYQKGEMQGLLGMYNSASNRMIICELANEVSQKQVYETLVHESWHTVQDCIAGLENSNILALSQTIPGFRQEVLGGISLDDIAIIDKAYAKQQSLAESEARFMESKPELVLDYLRRCQS